MNVWGLEQMPNVHACPIECSRHSSLHALSPGGLVPWILSKRTAVAHLYAATGEHTSRASTAEPSFFKPPHTVRRTQHHTVTNVHLNPRFSVVNAHAMHQADALLFFLFQSHFDRVIAQPCHAYFLPSSSLACLPPPCWPSSPHFLLLIAARCLLLTLRLGRHGVSPPKASTSHCLSASFSHLPPRPCKHTQPPLSELAPLRTSPFLLPLPRTSTSTAQ